MLSKLHRLATVQMGYSFRSRLETSEGGGLAVIQMKDLMDNNTVNCDDLVRIDMEAMKGYHLAKRGDLVFRARGSLNTAAILFDDPGKAVVSAPLLRIRVMNPDKILPEYLNWYISQRDAQIFLTSRAEGTFLKMISKQMVENLEIALPSIDRQKNIIELATLSANEEDLLHTLAIKRRQYVGARLMEIAKGEMN